MQTETVEVLDEKRMDGCNGNPTNFWMKRGCMDATENPADL
jgi:hypothetical protein